jgi:hypothetical protein
MRHTYLVVDQNYLRNPDFERLMATRQNTRIVLPDLAMFEMAKSDERELTIRRSLTTLAKYSHRVFMARAIGECLKYELERAEPVSGHMLSREATQYLRQVLRAVSTGRPNAVFERVVQDPEKHILDLKRDYLDHASNKRTSLELVEAAKREMSTEFASRVRGKRATSEEKIAFVREKAPSLLTGVLEENNFSRERALNFVRKKPLLLRYFYVNLWACINWEEQGRLECLGPEKVSNDLLDREYVLSATFFDGILSCDGRVNEAYAATAQMLTAKV